MRLSKGVKNTLRWLGVGTTTVVVIGILPFISTLYIKHTISLYNFSPLDVSRDTLKNHLREHSWIFSLLNLAKDIPYYKVSANLEGVDPAIQQVSSEGKIIQSVPYDSLSCLNDGRLYDVAKITELDEKDWTGCSYIKYLGWGLAKTSNTRPKIDLTLGWESLSIVFFTIFVLWNSFLLLVFQSVKTIGSGAKACFFRNEKFSKDS